MTDLEEKMKTRIKIKAVIVMLTVMACFGISKKSNAADKYLNNSNVDMPKTINGISFVAKRYEETDKYEIVMKKNGITKIIAKNTTCDFTTNGKLVYYCKIKKKINSYETKNCIYKYDIKTGKKRKILSGRQYTVRGCSGRYLYCGIDEVADGIKLYSYDLKQKKKKYMISIVGSVAVYGNYVVTSTLSGDAGNSPINCFKLNGTGKKKICDGSFLKAEKGKLYYYVVRESDWKNKIYTCSFNGKNKKAITGWIKRIPDKYWGK